MSEQNELSPAALVDLSGKVALVTGAASGIGRAQALLFAAAGCEVIAVDRNGDGLAQIHSEQIKTITADLATIAGVEALVSQLSGRIDILCNTAGFLDNYTPSLDTDEVLWDRVFDINVKAIYRLTNALLPGMIEAGGGIIVNMSSIASVIAGGGGAAYTASKHAVVGYTRQLSADYGRHGIRVNAICPGMIETGMTEEVLKNEKLAKVLRAVPAGRMGKPEDIAALSLFLAGPGAAFIHGAAMFVDGGLTIR